MGQFFHGTGDRRESKHKTLAKGDTALWTESFHLCIYFLKTCTSHGVTDFCRSTSDLLMSYLLECRVYASTISVRTTWLVPPVHNLVIKQPPGMQLGQISQRLCGAVNHLSQPTHKTRSRKRDGVVVQRKNRPPEIMSALYRMSRLLPMR
jgi:hypothetical protein